MIKINLNPKAKEKKTGTKLPTFSLPQVNLSNYVYVAIFVIPIIVVMIYAFVLNHQIDKLTKEKNLLAEEKNRYQAVLNKIKVLNKEVAQLKKTVEKLENIKLVYTNLKYEKGLFLKIFSAVSESLPDGVWINKMNLNRNSSTFEGFSFKPDYISVFYKKLNKYYANVDFSAIERKENNMNDYYTFSFSLSGFKYIKNKEGEKN